MTEVRAVCPKKGQTTLPSCINSTEETARQFNSDKQNYTSNRINIKIHPANPRGGGGCPHRPRCKRSRCVLKRDYSPNLSAIHIISFTVRTLTSLILLFSIKITHIVLGVGNCMQINKKVISYFIDISVGLSVLKLFHPSNSDLLFL